MSTWVKICGLRDERSVRAAIAAGADAVGFVCVETSPRSVSRMRVLELASLALSLGGIPVLVTSGRSDVHDAVRDGAIPRGTWLQLHGAESPDETRRLAETTGAPVIKALPVATRSDLAQAADYPAADRLLLDAKPPKGADREGGHGRAFDWSLLQGWRAPAPWILSGGLAAETVADAIRITGATAVDVSSGVESSPGVKDLAKVAAFVAAAKAARPSGVAA